MGLTEAQVSLVSDVAGTKLDFGGGTGTAGFGGRKDSELGTVNAGSPYTLIATAGTKPGRGLYESAYYTAFAADGSALHGFVAGAANVQVNDRCVFVASGFG